MRNDRTAELQRMLRFIEISENGASGIYPSGVYDDAARSAVTGVQHKHGLAETGKVDHKTWEAVVGDFDELAMKTSPPARVCFFPPVPGYSAGVGDTGDLVTVIQIILNELRRLYDSYPFLAVDGVFGRETEKAVKAVQRAHRTEESGRVDKATWDSMAAEYNCLTVIADE